MKRILFVVVLVFCIVFPLNCYAQHCPYPYHLYDVSILQVCSEKHPAWTSISYANSNYVHGGNYVKFKVYENGCSQNGYGSYQRLYHKGGDTEFLNLTLDSETTTLCSSIYVCGRTKIWTTQGADGGEARVRFKNVRYCAYHPYSCSSQNSPCNWTYSWDESYIKWRPDEAIQGRIDVANSDDTITIENGIFDETDIYLGGKSITLESESGPDSTTINLEGDGSTLICESGDFNSTVDGFTITGGSSSGTYTSPSCDASTLTFTGECKIQGDVALTTVGFCRYPDS